MALSSTYQSTGLPLLSTLYEPPPKHLISVLEGHTRSYGAKTLSNLVHFVSCKEMPTVMSRQHETV